MSRTIEVGRAVLSSSTQRLELWLTTLITISPSQQIDNQQLSSPALLRLLSSGNAWVGRGRGMLMQIELTLRGEPLPQERFQGLIDNILSAPVWAQLKLKATLAIDGNLDEKTTAININHCESASASGETNRHRLFCDVPATDVQPSDGVPRYQLQAVHLSIGVLEPKQRPRMKRSKTSPAERSATESYTDHDIEGDDESDSMLHDMLATASSPGLTQVNDVSRTIPANRKRKRQRTSAPTRTSSSPAIACTQQISPHNHSATGLDPHCGAKPPPFKDEMEEIGLLIDGAMRLSIYGINKPYNGLKIKANTFGAGLADVAPALWRPGHLAALSQRAHLLPTISRSFAQVSVTSVSLGEKIRNLSAPTSTSIHNDQTSATDGPAKPIMQSLSDRLWLHLQKNLLAKAASSLQACVARYPGVATQTDTDEILDHDRPEHTLGGLEDFGIEDHSTTCSMNDNTEQHIDILSPANPAIPGSADQSEVEDDLDTTRDDGNMLHKNDAFVEPSSVSSVHLAQDDSNTQFDIPLHTCRYQGMLAVRSIESDYMRDVGIVAAAEDQSSTFNLHGLPGVAHAEQTLEENLLFDGLDEDA